MGSKGNKRTLKRLNTPGFLQIERKKRSSGKYFMKPRPGAHPMDFCLPLGHLLRDVLKFTSNLKEAKYLIRNSKIMVDGKIRKDHRYPVGLMDVIKIDEIEKYYRVLPSKRRGLILSEISEDLAKFKLCRIENKTTVKGGNCQLNLHDGRNIEVSEKEGQKYSTRGTVKISIPDQTILDYFPLEVGNQAIIKSGNNIGVAGSIAELDKRFGVNASLAKIESSEGIISTSYEYVFPIGHEESAIDLPME